MFCVATLDQLKNPDDFVVYNNIVVQNINNKLLAFDNTCPHRGSKLQSECSGNRQLKCKYHGWTFDDNGKALTKLASAQLTTYKLKIIGNFVFIDNLDRFDILDVKSKLEEISNNLKTFVGENRIIFNASLDIVLENTLESYHVATVHKNTFIKEGLRAQPTSIEYYNQASAFSLPLGKDNFYHLAVYPNLSIGVTNITTYIGILREIDKTTTEFFYRMYAPSFLRKKVISFTNSVLNEDRDVCEGIQDNLKNNPNFKPIITMYEPRVRHFQNWKLK